MSPDRRLSARQQTLVAGRVLDSSVLGVLEVLGVLRVLELLEVLVPSAG